MQRLKTILFGLLLCSLAAGVGTTFKVLAAGLATTSSSETMTAKAQVAKLLRDPTSVQWGDFKLYGTTACGMLNAKNGFGGYNGMTRFIYMPDGVTLRMPHTNILKGTVTHELGTYEPLIFESNFYKSYGSGPPNEYLYIFHEAWARNCKAGA